VNLEIIEMIGVLGGGHSPLLFPSARHPKRKNKIGFFLRAISFRN